MSMDLIVSTRNLFFSSVHKAFIWEKILSTGALLPGRHIRTALSFRKFEVLISSSDKSSKTFFHRSLNVVQLSFQSLRISEFNTCCRYVTSSNTLSIEIETFGHLLEEAILPFETRNILETFSKEGIVNLLGHQHVCPKRSDKQLQ